MKINRSLHKLIKRFSYGLCKFVNFSGLIMIHRCAQSGSVIFSSKIASYFRLEKVCLYFVSRIIWCEILDIIIVFFFWNNKLKACVNLLNDESVVLNSWLGMRNARSVNDRCFYKLKLFTYCKRKNFFSVKNKIFYCGIIIKLDRS